MIAAGIKEFLYLFDLHKWSLSLQPERGSWNSIPNGWVTSERTVHGPESAESSKDCIEHLATFWNIFWIIKKNVDIIFFLSRSNIHMCEFNSRLCM